MQPIVTAPDALRSLSRTGGLIMSRYQATGRLALICSSILSVALVAGCGGYEGQLSGEGGFLSTAAARVVSGAGEPAVIVSSATAAPGATTDTVLPSSPTNETIVSSATAAQSATTVVTATPTVSTPAPTIALTGGQTSTAATTNSATGASTVTGVAALMKVAAPSFSGTPMYPGIAYPVVDATWSGGTPDSVKRYRVYMDDVNPSVPYVDITGESFSFIPNLDNNPYLLSQAGVTTSVGHTIKVDMQVTVNGVTYTSDKSNGYVVQAPPSTVSEGVNTPAIGNPSSSVVASGITPLPPLKTQTFFGSGSGVGYSGQTITGADGTARMQRFTDVLNTGRAGYLMRTRQTDAASNFGGSRAQLAWYGAIQIAKGTDAWFAFAINPIAGEWPNTSTGISGDEEILFETHAATAGDTLPPTSLARNGNINSLRLFLNTGWVGSGTQQVVDLGTNSNITPGVWTKFIFHVRHGDNLSYNPVAQLWINGTLVVNRSGSAAFSDGLDDGIYPLYGIYKYWANWAGTSSRAAYFSELFFETGTGDMYSRAQASLVGF